MALVAQLLAWAAGFIFGFALMLQPTTHNLVDGLLQALGSLFTVGTIHPGGAENLPLDVAAGAIWVVVVALQIAYLPALYAAFSQREGLVAMLESRAGVPAWGPELFPYRHQLVGIIDTLPDLYSAWEEWAASRRESHDLPGAAPLPLPRTVVLVVAGAPGRARRGRHAPGSGARHGLLERPAVPADGLHRPGSHRLHARLGAGPRSPAGGAARAHLRGV